MASTLIEKQKVIDYFKNDELKNKHYCVNKLLWGIFDMRGTSLLSSTKKEIIKKNNLVDFIRSKFNNNVVENPEVISSIIEAEYTNSEDITVADGYYTGYNLAYDEVKEKIPDCVYNKVKEDYSKDQIFGKSNILLGCIEELVRLSGVNESSAWVPGHYDFEE